MILAREQSIIVEWSFAIGTLAVLLVEAWLFAHIFGRSTMRRRPRRLTIAACILLLWVAGAAWVRIHTGVGVLLLGGSKHWVSAAAAANSDTEATRILMSLVASSNYGVNAAEQAVLSRSAPEQVRLFTLLSNAVPWENWKATYRQRASQARSRIRPAAA